MTVSEPQAAVTADDSFFTAATYVTRNTPVHYTSP